MNLYDYEYVKCSKIINDDLREFCLCERLNEEYMRRKVVNNFRSYNIAKDNKSRNLILYIKSSILGVLKRWKLNVQNISSTK